MHKNFLSADNLLHSDSNQAEFVQTNSQNQDQETKWTLIGRERFSPVFWDEREIGKTIQEDLSKKQTSLSITAD